MFKLVLFASFLALGAKACMPINSDSGEIQPFELSSTPKFLLKFSPPTSWTFGSAPAQGQSADAATALGAINTTINDAFKNAFTRLNIQVPSDYRLNLDEFTPQNITLAANPPVSNSGEGVVELNAVTLVCKAATCETVDSLSPFVLNQTVFVEKGPLLSGNQWHDVADQLFIQLSSKSVVFQDDLIAEKS